MSSNVDGYLSQMQLKCFDFTKVVEEFRNKNEEMDDYNNRDFKANREDIYDLMHKEQDLYESISSINEELLRMNIKDVLLII